MTRASGGRRAAGLALLTVLLTSTTGGAQAARPRVAIVYGGGESTGPFEIRRAVDPDVVDLTVFAPGKSGEPLRSDTRLDGYDVLLIDGRTPGLAEHAAQVAAARSTTRVAVLSPADGMAGNVDLTRHAALERYWANASQDNYRQLVRYLVREVLGNDSGPEPAPPIVYPAAGFYHPRAPRLFPSLADLATWERSTTMPAPRDGGTRLTVGLTVSMASYQQRNLAHVDRLIAAVEARGHRAATLVYRGAPSPAAFVADGRAAVDVVIQVGSVFAVRDRAQFLRDLAALDVPVLSAFHHAALDDAGYDAAPTGLLPALGSAVVEAEMDARFEPMPVSGRGAERGDTHFTQPYERSIEWRVDRALAWAKLRQMPNARKRVLFTYWSQGGGKANVGGDPDDFLDVPATIARLLPEMRARGYDVGPGDLPDRDGISRRMALEGSNVGHWAAGELAARVARGDVRLVPEDEYKAWFEALPENRRREVVDMWGPPPGAVAIYTDAQGRRSLVVPGLTFGNVVFAPNPDWGYLQDAKALMSTGELPPHHQYLAFFLWMQKTWRADAWVSFFSNISLQAGKPVGPLPDEHIGLLLGHVPHIHPERLGANGGLKSKRKALAQTVSWYSIVRPSGTGSEYGELRSLLQRYASLADEELRAEAERLIRGEVERSGLTRVLGVEAIASIPVDDLMTRVQRELDRLDRTMVPAGSKVLGDAAEGDALVDMVTAMLGREFAALLPGEGRDREALARTLVRDVIVDGKTADDALRARIGEVDPRPREHLESARVHATNLAAAPREVEALFEALDGRWIAPGSMDDPLRRPDAVPPGRSVYNFDSSQAPTVEAEALGIKQAEAVIAAHRGKHAGAFPTSLAFTIFSGETARTHGASEAQLLHLLGTRAVRDARGVVTGVQLIPREELGRPRVDVMLTASGTYRDHYPNLMALIGQAARLAAASGEADNPVRAAVATTETALRDNGTSAADAAKLARARVFAPAPGAYSPNVQFLAKSGDQRGDERKMAELYTSRLSHAYGDGLHGEAARQVFEQQLSTLDAASFARSSTVNGLLDNPMPAGFLGGLNLAAKAVTGRDLELYVDNLRDAQNPTLETASGEIQRELRTRYFDRSWVAEMQAHGYDGARTFMSLTDQLDLWDSAATHTVSGADWQEVKRVYVDDSLEVGMDGFFERYNPHAQQVLLGNLLSAAGRGQWEATDADKAQLAARLATSVAAHGIACEANLCRNPAFTEMVGNALAGTANGAALFEQYTRTLRETTTAPSTARETTTAAAPASSVTPNRAGRSAPGAASPAPAVAPSPVGAPAAPPAAAIVSGRVMEPVASSSAGDREAGDRDSRRWLLMVGLSAACLAGGWLRQARRHAALDGGVTHGSGLDG